MGVWATFKGFGPPFQGLKIYGKNTNPNTVEGYLLRAKNLIDEAAREADVDIPSINQIMAHLPQTQNYCEQVFMGSPIGQRSSIT